MHPQGARGDLDIVAAAVGQQRGQRLGLDVVGLFEFFPPGALTDQPRVELVALRVGRLRCQHSADQPVHPPGSRGLARHHEAAALQSPAHQRKRDRPFGG